LASAFFYLSRDPTIYKKLQNEVRSKFSSTDEIKTGQQLRSCTYLRACIDEALRLSPPVSSPLWREVQTGGIKIDGKFVPAGVSVGTSIYALHHNADNFVRPFEFSPERWIGGEFNSQEAISTAKEAFAPFSIGPRMCPAQNLAMAEFLITIAQVTYSLEFKIAEGKEGLIGQGRLGMGIGRERNDEFQIFSQFVTVTKKGPVLQFKKHEG
jgi:cytochrome P450